MENNEKIKVIIDTDPGVDDATAVLLAMLDKRLDIKLFTTASGNRPIEIGTRNMLHLIEKFGFAYPVSKGADKPLYRRRKDAAFIHGETGLGGYTPKKTSTLKCVPGKAEDNMYKVLKQHPGDITIVVLGAQTNIALLLQKYPDAKKLIKQIVYMGGSPYGYKKTKPHISFNISSDPEAFDMVLKSGIPLVMAPSELGRQQIFLSEKQVQEIENMNDFGAFLSTMYQIYWEPGYKDRRIAMNDSCAILYLVEPKLFKPMMGDITVDLDDAPGKTFINFHKKGQVKVLMKGNRKKAYNYLKKAVASMSDYKEGE